MMDQELVIKVAIIFTLATDATTAITIGILASEQRVLVYLLSLVLRNKPYKNVLNETQNSSVLSF